MASIEESMTHHAPNPFQIDWIEDIRAAFISVGNLVESCEPSRERSLAITKLEEALMWTVKSVILNEGK